MIRAESLGCLSLNTLELSLSEEILINGRFKVSPVSLQHQPRSVCCVGCRTVVQQPFRGIIHKHLNRKLDVAVK